MNFTRNGCYSRLEKSNVRAKRLDQKHSDDYLGQGCWACRDVSVETLNFFVRHSPLLLYSRWKVIIISIFSLSFLMGIIKFVVESDKLIISYTLQNLLLSFRTTWTSKSNTAQNKAWQEHLENLDQFDRCIACFIGTVYIWLSSTSHSHVTHNIKTRGYYQPSLKDKMSQTRDSTYSTKALGKVEQSYKEAHGG